MNKKAKITFSIFGAVIFIVLTLIILNLIPFISAPFTDATCDSGTLSDTCILNHTYYVTNGENINGTGNLIIGTNGSITNSSGIAFTINLTGNITILAGGKIDGTKVYTLIEDDTQKQINFAVRTCILPAGL